MRKIVFLSAMLSLVLYARENPFTPQDIAKAPVAESMPPKIQIQKPVHIQKEVKLKEPQKMIPIPTPVVTKKVVKKRKIYKKVSKPTLIYNGTFAKIKHHKNSIKIITKDTKLQQIKLTQPNRLAVDFERFDLISPFSKKIKSRYIRGLKVGHHDYFYRITLNLAKNYRYKITKKPYGYLVKFY